METLLIFIECFVKVESTIQAWLEKVFLWPKQEGKTKDELYHKIGIVYKGLKKRSSLTRRCKKNIKKLTNVSFSLTYIHTP